MAVIPAPGPEGDEGTVRGCGGMDYSAHAGRPEGFRQIVRCYFSIPPARIGRAEVWRVCAGLVSVYAGAVRSVSGRNMDKRSAMKMVNEHLGGRLLHGGNTSFANINASKPVWWINIDPSKFNSDLHLLLAKEGGGGLIWLRLEGNTFPDVRKVFRVRQDKDCIDLEISSRHPKYMTDIKSGGTEYDFAKHIEFTWAGPKVF